MSQKSSTSSESLFGPFAFRLRIWLLLAAVAFSWWEYSRWDAQRHTLTITWNGKSLILSTEDDAPYVVTHLTNGRGREMAALKEPLVVHIEATLTQEQIDQLVWRETGSGTECGEAASCRNYKAGDTVAAPRASNQIGAVYYRARMTEQGE